mgnify:CR=1 FL=1
MLVFDGKKIVISTGERRSYDCVFRKRDFQRKKVYEAETAAAAKHPAYLAVNPPCLVDGAIALAVYRLVSDKRFVKKYGSLTFDVVVEHKNGRHSAVSDTKVSFKSKGAICMYDIAHEAAHLVSVGDLHGTAFCRAMLFCTSITLGELCATHLQAEYIKKGVMI